MHVHTVTNIRIPELQPFRTLRRSKEQFDKGLFIAEGEKVFTRLLASGLRIRSILLTDAWFERKRAEIDALPTAPLVYVSSQETLEEIVGFALHQGIMALAEIPAQPELGGMMRDGPRPRLLLAIDDLVNAENVGVIVRNARAFGATGIIVGETSSSPYLRRAVRNSLGTVFSLPVLHVADLASALRSLSTEYGTAVFAAETRRASRPIDQADLTVDVCVVVGGEDKGIRQSVLSVCDGIVEIPMVEGMDSVNVANAAAVCLYEAQRQRRA